jgi:hypothetical protein
MAAPIRDACRKIGQPVPDTKPKIVAASWKNFALATGATSGWLRG